MSSKDAAKLKPGDKVRLKNGGWVIIVTGREESGRVVYGRLNGTHPVASYKNTEVKKEN